MPTLSNGLDSKVVAAVENSILTGVENGTLEANGQPKKRGRKPADPNTLTIAQRGRILDSLASIVNRLQSLRDEDAKGSNVTDEAIILNSIVQYAMDKGKEIGALQKEAIAKRTTPDATGREMFL